MSSYSSILLLIDCDALADISQPNRQREEILHTQNCLRVMNQVARFPETQLDSVVVLLNKADNILAETRGIEMRLATHSVPRKWADLRDRDLAMRFLMETTSGALHNLNHIYVKAYFCCTFGGVVQSKSSEGASDHPPYPLIPINVVEPILRELIDHEHTLTKG